MKALALALVCLSPLPAWAEPPAADPLAAELGAPLSGSEFESYALGKTLTYAAVGEVWGQEQYLPDHQVVWAFKGEPCEFGTWTEQRLADGQPMLCFTYGSKPGASCWQFFHGKAGLVALFVGDNSSPLSEVAQTDSPMQCPGPEVGV